jgi:hypothetical protein
VSCRCWAHRLGVSTRSGPASKVAHGCKPGLYTSGLFGAAHFLDTRIEHVVYRALETPSDEQRAGTAGPPGCLTVQASSTVTPLACSSSLLS